jgi:hypothetical protein
MMHTARNIRSSSAHSRKRRKILDPLMRKLRVVALGAHPEKAEELGEDFDKLIKGMEIKGVTQDWQVRSLHRRHGESPQRVRRYAAADRLL